MHHAKRVLQRVTAPASEPITLKEAKLYLRVDTATDDTLIADMIVAARMQAEQFMRRSLLTQSWKVAYVPEQCNVFALPMGPVQEITQVQCVSDNGDTHTLDEALYTLSADGVALLLKTIIIGGKIEITYLAGYGTASQLPRSIKVGMLAHIAAMYDGRGDMGDTIPAAVIAHYQPYREVAL